MLNDFKLFKSACPAQNWVGYFLPFIFLLYLYGLVTIAAEDCIC